MDFKSIAIAVAISICGFALEAWPRLKNRYFGIDTWRFALLADYIRKNRRLPDSIPGKYIVPGSVDNPPVLPLILSVLPKKWLDRNQGLISPFFDVLQSLTVFYMGCLVTGRPSGGHLAQVIYALTPVVPLEASNLSLRTLGSLVFTWAMLAIQVHAVHGSVYTLVLASALVVLLAYTHRMAVQVLFFSLIAFTVIDHRSVYLTTFFLGMALAIFLFRGLYLRYLRGQLLLISFWMYNIKNRLAHQVRGVPTSRNMPADFVRRIEYLIWKIPVVPLVAANPWILLVFWGMADRRVMWPVDSTGQLVPTMCMPIPGPWPAVMGNWAVILFCLSVLFSLGLLRFLGDGQRYLEYGTAAAAAAAAVVILGIPVGTFPGAYQPLLHRAFPWAVGAGCLVLIILFQKKLVLGSSDKSITPALWSVMDFLDSRGKEVRVACIPHGLADALAYFLKNGKVLLSDNSIGVWELQDFWPLIKRPLREIADKHALTHFLISTKYVRLEEIDCPGFEKAFEKGHYIVLQRAVAG